MRKVSLCYTPPRESAQKAIRRRKLESGKIEKYPEIVTVDFPTRYALGLRRCIRVNVSTDKYCKPKADMCFSDSTLDKMRATNPFVGCCPKQALQRAQDPDAPEHLREMSDRFKDWLEKDVQCYYMDAAQRMLPASDTLQTRLYKDAYANTIQESHKEVDKSGVAIPQDYQVHRVLWLVSNTNRYNYRKRFWNADGAGMKSEFEDVPGVGLVGQGSVY